MQVLSVVTPASFFSNIHLFCLLVCRMANFSVQHGVSGASAHGYAQFGNIVGPVFHRYSERYRFAKLACDLVEKHGFIAYQAKAYDAMGIATQWTQSITTAIDFMWAAFRAAIEAGDLTYACNGRIAGPSGAAAKLGIPRSTLESKIRRLGISKYEYKLLTS
jgi:predicted ATPase